MPQRAVDRLDGLLHGHKISPICTGDILAEIPLRHFSQVMRRVLQHVVQAENRRVQRHCQLGGLILGAGHWGRRAQIAVCQLLQPDNAGLDGAGNGPSHLDRHGESG